MQTELVNHVFFDEGALRLPPYKVGRITPGTGGRAYIRLTENGLEEPFRIYPSLTTSITQCEQTPDALIEWKMKLGAKEADRQAKVSAAYGSMMHEQIGFHLMNKWYDFDVIDDVVATYINDNNFYDPDTKDWAEKLRSDMAAWIKFCVDRNIKPVAIECVLLSDRHGYGTPIDLVCYIDVEKEGYWGEVYVSGAKKGQPKITKKTTQVLAIINFKSGRHYFYRNNGLQMHAEKMLWEENFPDMPLGAVINWSPKDWSDEPTYNEKDWYGLVNDEEIECVMKLANIRYAKSLYRKKYRSIFGMYVDGRDVTANIRNIDVETFCRRKFTNQPI